MDFVKSPLEAAGLQKDLSKRHPERSEAGFSCYRLPTGDRGSNPPLSATRKYWEMDFVKSPLEAAGLQKDLSKRHPERSEAGFYLLTFSLLGIALAIPGSRRRLCYT